MNLLRPATFYWWAALCLAAAGCGGKSQQAGAGPDGATAPAAPPKNEKLKNGDLNRWLTEVQVTTPPMMYKVQPPDSLKVTAPAIKELDGQTSRIRPDGKITLNLLGDVYVAGMNCTQIAQEIVGKAEKFYKKDTLFVSVEVVEFASKKYYVFGQVNAPGVKPYTGRDTLVKALAEAELNDDAWPQKVVLVRPHEDRNIRQKVTVDLKEMRDSGKTEHNYLIEEGDLIYVPPSPLAEFRMTFEKLLGPIIPMTDMAMMLWGF